MTKINHVLGPLPSGREILLLPCLPPAPVGSAPGVPPAEAHRFRWPASEGHLLPPKGVRVVIFSLRKLLVTNMSKSSDSLNFAKLHRDLIGRKSIFKLLPGYYLWRALFCIILYFQVLL